MELALVFPRVLSVFTLSIFEYSPENKNAMYWLFGNDVIFSSSRADNSTQSITV